MYLDRYTSSYVCAYLQVLDTTDAGLRHICSTGRCKYVIGLTAALLFRQQCHEAGNLRERVRCQMVDYTGRISKPVTVSFSIFWQVKVEVGVFENMACSPNGNIQSEPAK